jgi:hypothetical protein
MASQVDRDEVEVLEESWVIELRVATTISAPAQITTPSSL